MDAFLEACGAAGPIRLEIAGTRLGRRRRTLPRPYAVAGRAAGCDLRLPDARVASYHAYFQLIGGRLAAFDLGSRSGLRWDDGRPARSGWLDPGRVVQVGPFLVRRLLEPGDAAVAAPADTDIPPHNLRWSGGGPSVVLIFPDQLPGPIRWKMTRIVTLVGRAPGCRVRLPDESVAWYHAALVRTTAGVWLVDLLGRDGVTVNGATIRQALLVNNDEVAIGRFRMIVRYEDASHTPAAVVSLVDHPTVPLSPAVPPRPPEPAVELPLEPELMSALEAVRSDAATAPALMRLVEQFGRMQQQMLEQFYQSTIALVGQLDEHYREQMSQLRDELDGLRALSRELVELSGRFDTPLAPPAPGPSLTSPPAGPAAVNGHPPSLPTPTPPPTPKPPPTATPPRPAPTLTTDPLTLVTRRIAEIRGEQRSRWQRIIDLIRLR